MYGVLTVLLKRKYYPLCHQRIIMTMTKVFMQYSDHYSTVKVQLKIAIFNTVYYDIYCSLVYASSPEIFVTIKTCHSV